jgi:hypothetical protein
MGTILRNTPDFPHKLGKAAETSKLDMKKISRNPLNENSWEHL